MLGAFYRVSRSSSGNGPNAVISIDRVTKRYGDFTAVRGVIRDALSIYAVDDEWVARWGPPPSPLLWSHAMFLDLALALGEAA